MIEVRTLGEVKSAVAELFEDDVVEASVNGQWSLRHFNQLSVILDEICYEWFNVVEAPRSRTRKQPVLTPVSDESVAVPEGSAAMVYAVDYGIEPFGVDATRRRAADISGIYFSSLLKRPIRYDEVLYPVLLIALDCERGALISLIQSMDENAAPLIVSAAVIAAIIASVKHVSAILSKERLDNPLDRAVYLIALDYCLSHGGWRDEFTAVQMASWFEYAVKGNGTDDVIDKAPTWLKRRTASCARDALDSVRRTIEYSCTHSINRLCAMGYLAPVGATEDGTMQTYRVKNK